MTTTTTSAEARAMEILSSFRHYRGSQTNEYTVPHGRMTELLARHIEGRAGAREQLVYEAAAVIQREMDESWDWSMAAAEMDVLRMERAAGMVEGR